MPPHPALFPHKVNWPQGAGPTLPDLCRLDASDQVYSGSRKKHGLKGRPSPSQREVPNDVADRVFGYDNDVHIGIAPGAMRRSANSSVPTWSAIITAGNARTGRSGAEHEYEARWSQTQGIGDPGRNRKSTAGRDQRCCPDLGAAASEVVTSGQLVCSLVLAHGLAADPAPLGHRQARLLGPGPHGGAINPRRAHWISASAGCDERRECLREPGTVRLPEVDLVAHAVQAESGGLGPPASRRDRR
jgi:hypothetical protein